MKLPNGCERCNGEPFVWNGQAAERCDCPRGQRLAAEDRRQERRKRRPALKARQAVEDWQRAAAGER